MYYLKFILFSERMTSNILLKKIIVPDYHSPVQCKSIYLITIENYFVILSFSILI